jgi:melibiose permease/lactose/raffinose/galactose permease
MNGSLKVSKRTKYSYSIGCIGRDMAYTLFSTYLMVFFTNVIKVSTAELIAIGVIIAIIRVWDAINDPMMGILIDNTKSKWGKFKPWILVGALTSSIFIFLLFQDFGLKGLPFLLVFTIIFLLLETTFTMNDIAYWSMYPSFTTDPKERESIGSLARIFASLGMFIVIALVPLIYPSGVLGTPKESFFWMALIISIIYILCQVLVVWGVKEVKTPIIDVKQDKTSFKDLLKIIFKNDQLVVIIVTIFLFNIGYYITTSLGIYFFDLDFQKFGGIEFTLFSVVLAVSQLLALMVFPALAKKYTRKSIFKASIAFVIVGYGLLMAVGYLLPMNMLTIGIAGFSLFFGQGFIQVLTLVMLADTIEYGQLKLGTRNESVVFAINPFVTKLASSVQSIFIAAVLAFSKINEKVLNSLPTDTEQARNHIKTNMTTNMEIILRLSMIVIPLILIVISYVIYRKKYIIDDKYYKEITDQLFQREANKVVQ